jgi:RNA polymerase sigma-70 factor (ECF subfamily)
MDQAQPEAAEVQNLLGQVRAGDRVAFEQLFALYRVYLHQFVELRLDPKLRARVDSSDIVQEAQLEAVRRLQDYLAQPTMPFRLWLRQITYDRILKMHRHHVETARRSVGREVRLPEESSLGQLVQALAAGSTPSHQLNRNELAQRLRQAVEQLAEPDREVLLLRHFEGLSNQEVGYLLSLDPATVSKRHGRAMLRLHKILFDSGLTESQL